MLRTVFLMATAITLASEAHASARSFFAPEHDGFRLSSCLNDGAVCGKPVADAFCAKQGFAESIMFQREAVPAARIFDSGAICRGGACESFRRIKCYRPPSADQASIQQ